jgi:hypothetical protein
MQRGIYCVYLVCVREITWVSLLNSTNFSVLRYYRRLQNSKAFAGLKVGHTKIFNFSPNVYKLSNPISRDSGDSPDSNYTKYINYEYLDLKEIGVIFPSLRNA